MEYLIGVIIGFLIGLVIGIFLVCICVANGRDERVDMKLEPSKEFKTEMGCFITHDQAKEIDKLYLEKCKKLSEIEKVVGKTISEMEANHKHFQKNGTPIERLEIIKNDLDLSMEAFKEINKILED